MSQKLLRLAMECDHAHPIRVLVLEDSRTVRTRLRQYIGLLEQVSVTEVDTLQDARDVLARQAGEFFCAVVDLTLPDASGLDGVRAVLRAGVPAIVLTGSLDPGLRQAARQENIIEYVHKSSRNALENIAYLIGRLRQNQSVKVMVVDDSRTFRLRVRELLTRYRFPVLEAGDGQEALDLLAAHPDTALLLTDYHMPRLDGLELIGRIRARYRREDLAVIALSQSRRPELSAAMLKAGANDYLNKQFMEEEFYCRVLQNANMIHYVRTLQSMASRDYLTRLYNRRHLFLAAEALYAAAREQGTPLAVAMVDADHFKRINDRHGHAAGDEALKQIARVLRHTFPAPDIVARYGGEEFVCVVPLGTRTEAWARFEALRAAVEAIRMHWDGTPVPLTVSIGLTLDTENSLTAMIDRADQAVFHAKSEGRNRIALLPEAASLLPPG